MKDKVGKIIYIGKAKILKNRVRSYFHSGFKEHRAAMLMKDLIADIEWIITLSEFDALILEANLVHKHKPKFNVRLKDDKHYPYLCVTTNEKFPRLKVVREAKKDGNKYFGPFIQAKAVWNLLEVLPKIFKIRDCDLKLPQKSPERPCLHFHMGQCDAPCLVTRDQNSELLEAENLYKVGVNDLIQVLKGEYKEVFNKLEYQMHLSAKNLDFERAARYRDHCKALESLRYKQRMDLMNDQLNMDVVTIVRDASLATVVVVEYREGQFFQRLNFDIEAPLEQEISEIMRDFLMYFYRLQDNIPKELALSEIPEDLVLIQDFLNERAMRKVSIQFPKAGDKRTALELATSNARMLLNEQIAKRMKDEAHSGALESLKNDLGLNDIPLHIEGFDISHLGGTHTVASLIVFRNGKPSREEYRRYNVKTVDYIDDFASMREVVGRRVRRIQNDGLQMPDLFLIDGGKGQVSAAKGVLEELGFAHQPVIGLAKRLEEIVFPYREETLILDRRNAGLKVLQALRDECHRFAITFQRHKRSEDIVGLQMLRGKKGIGDASVDKLLLKYQTFDKLKEVSLEELQEILSKRVAGLVFEEIRVIAAG